MTEGNNIFTTVSDSLLTSITCKRTFLYLTPLVVNMGINVHTFSIYSKKTNTTYLLDHTNCDKIARIIHFFPNL